MADQAYSSTDPTPAENTSKENAALGKRVFADRFKRKKHKHEKKKSLTKHHNCHKALYTQSMLGSELSEDWEGKYDNGAAPAWARRSYGGPSATANQELGHVSDTNICLTQFNRVRSEGSMPVADQALRTTGGSLNQPANEPTGWRTHKSRDPVLENEQISSTHLDSGEQQELPRRYSQSEDIGESGVRSKKVDRWKDRLGFMKGLSGSGPGLFGRKGQTQAQSETESQTQLQTQAQTHTQTQSQAQAQTHAVTCERASDFNCDKTVHDNVTSEQQLLDEEKVIDSGQRKKPTGDDQPVIKSDSVDLDAGRQDFEGQSIVPAIVISSQPSPQIPREGDVDNLTGQQKMPGPAAKFPAPNLEAVPPIERHSSDAEDNGDSEVAGQATLEDWELLLQHWQLMEGRLQKAIQSIDQHTLSMARHQSAALEGVVARQQQLGSIQSLLDERYKALKVEVDDNSEALQVLRSRAGHQEAKLQRVITQQEKLAEYKKMGARGRIMHSLVSNTSIALLQLAAFTLDATAKCLSLAMDCVRIGHGSPDGYVEKLHATAHHLRGYAAEQRASLRRLSERPAYFEHDSDVATTNEASAAMPNDGDDNGHGAQRHDESGRRLYMRLVGVGILIVAVIYMYTCRK